MPPRLAPRSALVLALPGLVGCLGHLPPCPAAGGPPWRAMQSAHYRLTTDEDRDAARTTLRDLEQLRAVLLTVFHAPPDLRTGRLPVIVVRDGWTDFSDATKLGFYTRALFQPLVVMQAESDLAQQQVIKHELVHYLSGLVMPVQPLWLAEGLATYFETLEVDADKGQVTVGGPPEAILRYLQRDRNLMSVPELMAARQLGDNPSLFYASAWATVHYLMNHHATELAAYQAQLRAHASPTQAWASAFGALTPAALGTEIWSYLDGGQYELLIFPFRPAAADPLDERALSDADVHATRALLFAAGTHGGGLAPEDAAAARRDSKARARREVDEALRQEPEHIAGNAIGHFVLGAAVDPALARTLTEKHGDDWMAWMLLAEALPRRDSSGREVAAKRALDLAWEDPSVSITLIEIAKPAAGGGAPHAAPDGNPRAAP